MKKISITIIELKDIVRIFSSLFDKILFCFSRPKYKIGSKINMSDWGKNLTIVFIGRDWDYCSWAYLTDKKQGCSFSEGLIDYYLKEENKSRK